MGTSRKTFTQVRDILRKIDRSIDDVRSRRLGVQARPAPDNGPQATPSDLSDAPRKAQRRAQPRRFDDDHAVFRNGASSE